MVADVSRETLPSRRTSVTTTIDAKGIPVAVPVGFYEDGRPGEVFIVGGKEGSTMRLVLADAAVLISIALQYGAPANKLAETLLREPVGDEKDGKTLPASPLGAVLEIVNQGEVF